MLIKIALISGDEICASSIEKYFHNYSKESGKQFCFWHSTDGGQFVEKYEPAFHIIFIDTNIKNFNGIDIARYIRKLDHTVHIVLISDTDKYALKGYEIEVQNYLLKPIAYCVFLNAIKRLLPKINAVKSQGLFFNTDAGTVKIEYSDITYIESFRYKMLIHTASETYAMIVTMQTLEDKLPKEKFFRCSRSFIINIDFITKLRGNTVVVNGQSIAVSRNKRAALLERINRMSYKF